MSEIVTLRSGKLEVEVWTLGARLHAVRFDGSPNLLDSAANEAETLGEKKFHGATVGPVANRIAGASASIDGTDYAFEANERDITTLHSGSTGVHAIDWSIAAQNDTSVFLETTLKDGLGGFPGNRTLKANFDIIEGELHVSYYASTDAQTWINLALHPYWSLGKTASDLLLFVDADRYTPVDAVQIPTGEIASVDGTPFDLRTLAKPSTEIDHNYVLNAGDPADVILATDDYQLDITTDAPGVQIFTGKPFGFAIEPQHFPDAMHHANFPSIALKPDEAYAQSSVYRFTRL
jgi:aldose 1-epimerase